jgi:hypothetical protein
VKHSPGFLKLVDEAKSRVREVSVEETRRKLETGKAHVIDVREESEWAAGHAGGAEHLGKGVIERDIEVRVPDHDAEIILYCGGGFRCSNRGGKGRLEVGDVVRIRAAFRAIPRDAAPRDRPAPGRAA